MWASEVGCVGAWCIVQSHSVSPNPILALGPAIRWGGWNLGGFLGRAEGVLVRWGCGYDSDVLVIGGGSGYRLATRLAGCYS